MSWLEQGAARQFPVLDVHHRLTMSLHIAYRPVGGVFKSAGVHTLFLSGYGLGAYAENTNDRTPDYTLQNRSIYADLMQQIASKINDVEGPGFTTAAISVTYHNNIQQGVFPSRVRYGYAIAVELTNLSELYLDCMVTDTDVPYEQQANWSDIGWASEWHGGINPDAQGPGLDRVNFINVATSVYYTNPYALSGVWHPKHSGWNYELAHEAPGRYSTCPYDPRYRSGRVNPGVELRAVLSVDRVPVSSLLDLRRSPVPTAGVAWGDEAVRPLESLLPAMAASSSTLEGYQPGGVVLNAIESGQLLPIRLLLGATYDATNTVAPQTVLPGITMQETDPLAQVNEYRLCVLGNITGISGLISPLDAYGSYMSVTLPLYDVTPARAGISTTEQMGIMPGRG